MHRRTLLIGACAGAIAARTARATPDYPNRTITLIVPFSPGSSVGINAQLLQPQLEHELGQRIELQFSPGAGGAMGHLLGAEAPADGYTLTLTSASLAIQPWLVKASTVSPDNFTFIGQVTSVPGILLTRSDSGPQTLGELVATLRAQPDSLTTGDLVAWPSSSVAQAMFSARAAIRPRVVSTYYSGSELLVSLQNEQLDFITVGVHELRAGWADRGLRALAVTGMTEVAAAPGTPTFVELGWDITSTWWRALAAPRDTPTRIVETVGTALLRALATPALQSDFARNALSADPFDGPAMTQRVAEEYQSIGRFFSTLGINVRAPRSG